ITGTAEAVTEVWVRSKVARPVSGGWLMTTNDRKPVFDGKVDLELLPGACVLVAVSSGLPGETVELIVPESGTASLEACIRAAESAGDLERDALDELRRDFGAWIDEARASVGAADSSAKAAKAEAGKAAASATGASDSAKAAKADADRAKSSADSAGSSASGAKSSADAAKASADSAGKSASAAASSASAARTDAGKAASSATAAGKSATAAKADADRAATIASSTSWDGDKLTVNGKTSPPLTGPQGPPGKPGSGGGASSWAELSGVPGLLSRLGEAQEFPILGEDDKETGKAYLVGQNIHIPAEGDPMLVVMLAGDEPTLFKVGFPKGYTVMHESGTREYESFGAYLDNMAIYEMTVMFWGIRSQDIIDLMEKYPPDPETGDYKESRDYLQKNGLPTRFYYCTAKYDVSAVQVEIPAGIVPVSDIRITH
ncbi:TPA: hypothetical protein ACKLO9_001528, partial [Neisseria gonorrhoeae]